LWIPTSERVDRGVESRPKDRVKRGDRGVKAGPKTG